MKSGDGEKVLGPLLVVAAVALFGFAWPGMAQREADVASAAVVVELMVVATVPTTRVTPTTAVPPLRDMLPLPHPASMSEIRVQFDWGREIYLEIADLGRLETTYEYVLVSRRFKPAVRSNDHWEDVVVRSQRVGAICKDESRSYSTGRGTCSWHGGVRYWLYSDVTEPRWIDLPEPKQPPPPPEGSVECDNVLTAVKVCSYPGIAWRSTSTWRRANGVDVVEWTEAELTTVLAPSS